jgi:UDPglucose--hexose-1-phosphate uridylyltransferase
LLHLAPFDISADQYYQWHIELFPRLSNPAGYEWGTGCWINPVAPEEAAESLRGH